MADVKISGLPASTVPLAGTEVLPIVQSGTTKQVSIANVTAGRSVAALSVITPTIQAEAGSAGGTIKNGSGVAQMQWGSGGGSNLSLEVATNINPANAAVAISPTGTGTVAISPAGALTINPTAASTINNTSIGATTASTGRFTSVTATTGNVVIGTSGQGIDFSATPGTGTSELFADYEEGTFTPTITLGGGSVTYTTQTGSYTKIGRTVTVQVRIVINVATTPSSSVEVLGLPFASSAGQKGAYAIFCSGMAVTSKVWVGQVTAGVAVLRVFTYDLGTLANPGADFVDGCALHITATYEV
jgi:hypothetical protein